MTNRSTLRFVPAVAETPLTVLLITMLSMLSANSLADAVPVELRHVDGNWQLFRDEQPYFIRGAGGDYSLQALADAGGNSIRTWNADDIQSVLDEAHALGLTVTVGLWMEHERHGFDYSDTVEVAKQKQQIREAVLRYKDHPAVLLWGVGNEVEEFAAGDDPRIWDAINDIAAMVKELDPHHPTMAVTAELGGERIPAVHQRMDAIDIHGVNAYGGSASVARRLAAGGASKPFIITEFGPVGFWERPKTEWGAPLEQTSTEKADYYRRTYEQSILGAAGRSLGSYAFAWGYKMEATETWFGMVLKDGARLGIVDVMSELWTGERPSNLAPNVGGLTIEGSTTVRGGQTVRVSAEVADPEQDELRARWVLRKEADEYATGGDFRPDVPDIEGVVTTSSPYEAQVVMPPEADEYRLFYYVYDEHGSAATANLPLLVVGD